MQARRKGRGFEQLIAKRFQAIYPEAKRGFQFRSGEEAPDVDAGRFWIEAKCMKLTQPRQALAQATRAAPAGRVPIAVCKDNRGRPFVTLDLDHFLALVAELEQRRGDLRPRAARQPHPVRRRRGR